MWVVGVCRRVVGAFEKATNCGVEGVVAQLAKECDRQLKESWTGEKSKRARGMGWWGATVTVRRALAFWKRS